MDEKKRQILDGASKVFMKYGIKSITMDDVARNLGVSKKTLYIYFTNKNDLVLQCLECQQQVEHESICNILNESKNAIDENFEISKLISTKLKDLNPAVMFDIEKYYPGALSKMNEYRNQTIYNWVSDNIKRGIEEGLYREDLNVDIIASAYIARMADFHNQNLPTEKYSFHEIYLELFRYHVRGIASEKGLKYLKEKIKKEKSIL